MSDDADGRSLDGTVVIGVGNTMRRDDGVGPAVVDALAGALAGAPDVDLVALDGEATRLLDAWRGRRLAIVVDAVRTGAAPGTVLQVDPATADIPTGPPASSHAAGVAHAIELARALDALPDRLVLFGVEPADLDHGEGLSPEVVAALPDLVDRIRALLDDQIV